MKSKLALLVILSMLSACHLNPVGKQGFEHEATIKKGEQGDGFQGARFWKGDIIKVRVTFDSTAWFPVASKFYGDQTPIFKCGGFGEFLFFSSHRKNGAVVGWNPSTRKGYFWVGTYCHSGSKTPTYHYAMEVKHGEQFEVTIRKSSTDNKFYYLFVYQGKTYSITEEGGKEFICYLTYFFLGGENATAVYAPHPLKAKIIYEEVL